MKNKKSNNPKSSRVTRRPLRLEPLEHRQLMAGLTMNLDLASKTLTINGTATSDSIAIVQNDASNKLSINATSGRDAPNARTFPSNMVNRLFVQLGAGDDQFTFQTKGDAWNRKEMQLDLGEGDDTVKVGWAEDRSVAFSNLSIVVTGGAGSDAFGARVGRAGFDVATTINADMGSGDDGFVVQALNPGLALSRLTIAAVGGDGDDQLQFFGSELIASRATTNLRFDGQAGDDLLEFFNQGRIDGQLTETLIGGDGNDSISTAAVDSNGLGRYSLNAEGNAGDDAFAVDIRSANGKAVFARSVVNGGEGTDTANTPRDTTLQRIEVSMPIGPQSRPTPSEPFYPALPTSTMKVADRTVEYWSRGWSDANSPVIVLLTGAGGSIDSWLPITWSLDNVGMVIAVNKPGYGRTDAISTKDLSYNLAVIEDVRAVVSRLAPGRQVILVGHSIGGAYSNLYARLHPTEIAGVLFVDATQQIRAAPEDVANEFGSPVYRVYPRGVRDETASIAAAINAPLDAPAFPKAPVIALTQELPEEQLALVQTLADLGFPGTLQVVKDAGHYLQADQPRVVVDSIAELVRLTQISGILADVVAKYGVPGLSASVVIGGQTMTGSAGVRVEGTQVKVQTNDRFAIGSTTKAMTATLAGILVERGMLHWDSTIAQLFPELKATMKPEYRNVTIEQLLQHRGGVVADGDASPELAQKVANYKGPDSQARLALLPDILKERLPVRVGEFRYSNAGYAVAGAMMERVTRIPYEQLMQRTIFSPLGMSSAVFSPPPSNPRNPQQPIGHLPDGTPAPGDRPPFSYLAAVLRPAGSDLRMNATDWSKFVRIHLGQSVNGVRLLKPETITRLQKPIAIEGTNGLSAYAIGWELLDASSIGLSTKFGRILTHQGSDGVWLSEVTAFADLGFSIQILANGTTDKNGIYLGGDAFNEIKVRLLQRFTPKLPAV
ncbi:MAG: alpha/beta fold hydrolase [Planctomycetota bacterium]|nr:alpha/beta fold hydrolase [Planctomycetota bacterium]